ncbi:MAG: 5-(carboxyamino)imidazole ribonucleotide mutase [Gammaproteobacteria bacterium]|jgi:phosphoribosylaminoimidazole carboxylase PurE protein|nr:5-(carboxyamino)imidazole ribonucleotide mutase [Gammaproteobacteria bacterium]
MDNIQVSVILGSDSDVDLGKAAIKSLRGFDIACELKVISAHRSPDVLVDYLKTSKERGCKAYIAIAGMAAHLAGAVAAHSSSPVLGVPTEHSLNGLDAILSTLQMPAGVPVATFAAGTAGATNAGIFAAQMLGIKDQDMANKMVDFKKELREKTIKKDQNLNRD